MNGHKNDFCPNWDDPSKPPGETRPTPAEARAYGAAFKQAQRSNKLHQLAIQCFQKEVPGYSVEEIVAHLEARPSSPVKTDSKTAPEAGSSGAKGEPKAKSPAKSSGKVPAPSKPTAPG